MIHFNDSWREVLVGGEGGESGSTPTAKIRELHPAQQSASLPPGAPGALTLGYLRTASPAGRRSSRFTQPGDNQRAHRAATNSNGGCVVLFI